MKVITIRDGKKRARFLETALVVKFYLSADNLLFPHFDSKISEFQLLCYQRNIWLNFLLKH